MPSTHAAVYDLRPAPSGRCMICGRPASGYLCDEHKPAEPWLQSKTDTCPECGREKPESRRLCDRCHQKHQLEDR